MKNILEKVIDMKKYISSLTNICKAAEQGNADAQFNLGLMYNSGEGVPRDDAETVKLWRKAAEQGHAEAQLRLDMMKDKSL